MEAICYEALGRMANVAMILPLIEVYRKLNCHTYEKRRTGRQWKKEGTREETRKKEEGKQKKNEKKKEMGQEREKERRGLKIPNIYGNFALEPIIPM